MEDVDVFPAAQVLRSYCARSASSGGLTWGPISTPTALGGTGNVIGAGHNTGMPGP